MRRDEASDSTPPSRRWDEPAVVLALVLILLGALWATALARPIDPADDSPEAGFARDMMTHHAQAVEMADIVRARTKDPTIRVLATDIVLTQQAQIGQFQGWLAAWGLPIGSAEPAMSWMGHPTPGLMPGLATDEEIAALGELPPKEADARLLQMMIPHHRAALTMARAILDMTDKPEVVAAGRKTLEAQGAEIALMQELLVERGYPRVGRTSMSQMPGPTAEGHGGGGSALTTFIRTIPIAAGLGALAWLLLDTVRRRQEWVGDRPPLLTGHLAVRSIAIAGLAISGVIHLALMPEHLQESTSAGLFFGLSGAVSLFVAAWILAWPRRASFVAASATALTLIVVYLLSRTVGIPVLASEVESIDALGITAKVLEIIVLITSVWVVRSYLPRSTHPEDRSELTELA